MDTKSEILERDQLINYLREQLIKVTGQDVEVPYKWERFTGPAIAPKFTLAADTSNKTFTQAVKDLDLPMPPSGEPKKGDPPPEPIHCPEYTKITLSNYSYRGVNKDALLSLVGGIKRLSKLKAIDLSRDALNDTMCPEIDELFKFNKLVRINLSNNDLGKGFLNKFSEIIKSGGTHLEWLDLSGNPFSSDAAGINALTTNLKRLVRLYHFSISIQGSSVDTFVKSIMQIKNITNFGLPQSRIPAGAITTFEALCSINLSQCYLDSRSIVIISETLKHNRSLVKLDLSHNGISTNIGRYLAMALRLNNSLTILNLAHNDLGDGFCQILLQELRNNQTLYECNLGGNPFAQVGADALMLLIQETKIGSLGNLDLNRSLSVTAREGLKGSLGVFKNEYKLLAPIEETNPFGTFSILPWNLTNAIG